jgi:hypothetical protein
MDTNDQEPWMRLGRLLTRRRKELGYRTRPAFIQAKHLPHGRIVSDLENGVRSNYDPSTLIEYELAYEWAEGSIAAVLAGGEPSPLGTAPGPSSLTESGRALQEFSSRQPVDQQLALVVGLLQEARHVGDAERWPLLSAASTMLQRLERAESPNWRATTGGLIGSWIQQQHHLTVEKAAEVFRVDTADLTRLIETGHATAEVFDAVEAGMSLPELTLDKAVAGNIRALTMLADPPGRTGFGWPGRRVHSDPDDQPA